MVESINRIECIENLQNGICVNIDFLFRNAQTVGITDQLQRNVKHVCSLVTVPKKANRTRGNIQCLS